KVCPDPDCRTTFSKQVGGRTEAGRWNYRVDRQARPRGKAASGESAAIVDLGLMPTERLEGSPSGKGLGEDLGELNEASCRAIPNAPLALWAKILHGAVWAGGQREGWWKPEWDDLSLTNILSKRGRSGAYAEIAIRTPASLVERLELLSVGRAD